MSSALVLVLVVVGAYLAAHVVFEWLARHYLIVSGAEYLLLGILLGPQVADLITATTVDRFAAFLTLALGWIGALVGAQFYVPALIRIRAVFYRVAFVEAVVSMALVVAVMAAVLAWAFPITLEQAVIPAVAMGAIACVSAPSGIAVVARRLGAAVPVVRQLQVATAVDALVAITAFGLLLSIMHVPPPVLPRPPTATEWAVISVGIGLVGGALFHLFLGGEQSIDRLFIALAGAIILASGAAAFLRLSPLLPTMLIGAILINTSPNRAQIREVLGRVERPLYFVLMIFAGAAWRPSSYAWVAPVILFLVVRVLAKLAGAWFAAAANRALPLVGPGWGKALLAQGGLALAIALNYRISENSPFANIVFTATIASILLTDLSSARLVDSAVRSFRRRIGGEVPRPPEPPRPPQPPTVQPDRL